MGLITRRVLLSIIVFFVAINLDFLLPRLVPGNAAEIFASSHILPGKDIALIEARFGLNQPLPVQYFLFLKSTLATFPPFFGFSYEFYPQTVSSLILSRAPWTILLIVTSFFLAFTISYFVAGISAMKREGTFAFMSLYSAVVFWSIPAFWFGLVLIWIFGVTLGWLPLFGTTGFVSGNGLDFVLSFLQHAVLPVATLTAVIFGQNYLMLRGAAQEVLGSDYIVAARARGIGERVIAFGYVIRNSLMPLVALTGYAVANLISAVIVVEFVFAYGGIGDLIVDAIITRDYPLIEGCFYYITLFVIIFAFIGDLLLRRMDPRLRS